eukprot:scaffold11063_cov116-Skeletonema_menzelii.AAC.2
MSLSSVAAATLQKFASRCTKLHLPQSASIILGGGIAGCRFEHGKYLLGYMHQHRNVRITLVDRNFVDNKSTVPSSAYEDQHTEYPHFSTPSRRNGNGQWTST